jgi:hypothetical protein
VVGDVPDSNDRDAEFGVRSGVTAFDTVERIVRSERGEDAVRVVEGVLEILNQFGLGFRRIAPTLFAVLRRFLALKFVKEGELGAGVFSRSLLFISVLSAPQTPQADAANLSKVETCE